MGIDVGTGSVRVGVYAHDGFVLGSGIEPFPTRYPRPGWTEQSAEDWWDAIAAAVRCALAEAGTCDVEALTVSTTSSTVVVADDAGRPLRPAILWMDGRAADESAETARLAHPALAASGGSASAEWLLTKAMWLARNEPEVYAGAAHISEALDYVNFRLTGRWVASRLNATCKLAYDNHRGFPRDLYDLLGVSDLLDKIPTEVVAVGDVLGRVSDEAAEQLGLAGNALVVQGGIDAHMGMIGTGSTVPGSLCVVAGTSIVHLTHVESPVYAPGIWGPYPDALVDGLWLVEGGQVSGGSILKWLVEDVLGTRDYQSLEEQAARKPVGSSGLLVLDFWMGSRTPYKDPHLRGAILGLRLSHDPAELYRALLESIAYGTRNVLRTFAEGGVAPTDIRVCGGLAQNRLWLQMLSDTLGLPVRVMTARNPTLTAGALCAATAAGHYSNWAEAGESFVEKGWLVEPDDSSHEKHLVGFERYRRSVELLTPLLHELDSLTNVTGEAYRA